MKNLIKISVLALAATALMVSCQRETAFEEAPVSNTARTFTLTFAQPDSKVAIGEGANLGKTKWEVGDVILVHGEYTGEGKSLNVTLTANDISADGKTATITVEGVTPYERPEKFASTLYAAYPASAVKDNDHCYYYSDFVSTQHPLMAAYNDGDTFVFYNLTGIVTFQATGDFDKFEFFGNGGEPVGYSFYRTYLAKNLDGAEKPARLDFSYASDGGTSGPITTYAADLVSGTNYVYLPNGANFTAGFTIKFYKGDDLKKIAKTETAVNVARNSILELGDITAKLEDYVPPTTSDHKSEITGATDISAKQANSYIITAPGAYKFPALKGCTDEAAGEVFDVALLWETYNTEDEVTANSVIAKVDFEDNWIYFQTPETLKAGNAVIAAKNAEGKVIWNWLIWIPETAIEDINDATLYPKPVMDRNLGAMIKATTTEAGLKTYGLYYQWGRIAPMPGGAASVGAEFDVQEGPKALNFAIQNPTTYIKVGESDSAGNWCEADLSNLWAESDGSKAAYDPCPAGYQVPAYDESYALFAKNNDGWTYEWESNYFAYGEYVFPLCGWLTGSVTPSYIGERSIITSNKAHSTPRASLKIVRKDKGGFYYHNYFKVEATSVRCVAE